MSWLAALGDRIKTERSSSGGGLTRAPMTAAAAVAFLIFKATFLYSVFSFFHDFFWGPTNPIKGGYIAEDWKLTIDKEEERY